MRWVIIGNGAWAQALGATLQRNNQPKTVQFWARNPRNENETNDIRLLSQADILLWAASTSALGHIDLPPQTPVILTCKGIQFENGKLKLPSDWLGERPIGILSGPTFAHEVVSNLPTALVLASAHADATQWADQLRHLFFRIYHSHDLVGVQVGGAVKNVVALASGLCRGLQLGQNAAAALVTRGLCEIQRIGTYLGADAITLTGLSGLGDMLLTSTSLDSRNTKLGYDLAHGLSLEKAMEQAAGVAESVRTTQALYHMRHHIHLPLVTILYRILFEDLAVADGVNTLLSQQRGVSEFAV